MFIKNIHTQKILSKKSKKLSFLKAYSSNINYTFWLQNFLTHKCFNEQLPSLKRAHDKIYSEAFLNFLVKKSNPFVLYNLKTFFLNDFSHIVHPQPDINWITSIKLISLLARKNSFCLMAAPLLFSLKKISFVFQNIYFLFLRGLISGQKLCNTAYIQLNKKWLSKLIEFFLIFPQNCFSYQTMLCCSKYISKYNSVLLYYWYIYHRISYNKILFHRKLLFNYLYCYKNLIKKPTLGPFLTPYSTLTFQELSTFGNYLSTLINQHTRFMRNLDYKLSWFFKFLYSLVNYKQSNFFYYSSCGKYQKWCYDYLLLKNNILPTTENSEYSFVSNPNSQFNLFLPTVYSSYITLSYEFIRNSFSFFTDSFYFYFQKFTKYFLFCGNNLRAFSNILLLFNRLLRINLAASESDQLVYFSDGFTLYMPSISLTTKSVSKNSTRTIAVPKLLKATKRIPKALQRFTLNAKNRKETMIVQRLFSEFTDLLELRGETIKYFVDVYKGALINLQFSQSLARSFSFEYRARVYPTTVSKLRRRVRLENQLNYF